MGNVFLEVKNLKTKYVTRFREDVYAVDDVSFRIEEGKFMALGDQALPQQKMAEKYYAGQSLFRSRRMSYHETNGRGGIRIWYSNR